MAIGCQPQGLTQTQYEKWEPISRLRGFFLVLQHLPHPFSHTEIVNPLGQGLSFYSGFVLQLAASWPMNGAPTCHFNINK